MKAPVVCPYCNKDAACVDSAVLYGKSYGLVWWCRDCDAYVGCHDGTDVAKGTLANAALREARKRTHAAFDPIWKTNQMHRRDAYQWLASTLGIPVQECHIGMFNLERCNDAILACKTLKALNDA